MRLDEHGYGRMEFGSDLDAVGFNRSRHSVRPHGHRRNNIVEFAHAKLKRIHAKCDKLNRL